MEAVIIDGVRTPLGRYGGVLKNQRPDDLAAFVIAKVLERTGAQPASIDDVIFGAANQAGEDNRNVARMATLIAGLPETVPGQTVNRLCGSGLQALNTAAHAIRSGEADAIISGGVESMSRAPFVLMKPERAFPRGVQSLYDTTIGWRLVNPVLARRYPPISLGETAENLADQYEISREEQDVFALSSHQKAIAAAEAGRFDDEIAPIEIATRGGSEWVRADETPRPDTSLEKLAALKPAFREAGTVTAGNSSSINDGAAALLVTSADYAQQHGLRPRLRVVGTAVAGVNPQVMGIGPVPAVRKVLLRTGLTLEQMDVIELNEAFAAQSLAVLRELRIDPEDPRLNPNGGAIALGHPLGCSGARITVTLLHEMERRGARYGLATMCIGVGQGIATVFESAS